MKKDNEYLIAVYGKKNYKKRLQRDAEKEKNRKRKFRLFAVLVIIFVVIALIIIAFFGTPTNEYYPGKPKFPGSLTF